MKRIAILTTGGTIAMKSGAAGLNPVVSGSELTASVPSLSDWAEVFAVEVSNIPSEFMTPAGMLALARRIDTMAGEADGFVVTHGTDTMEETAFFLDVVLRTEKTVVLTGAMRGASALSADGPANLEDAVRIAADDGAAGMGVLVAMGGRIHAARDVEKMHATLPEAFQSPQWGPLGTVYSDRITWGRRPMPRKKVHPESLSEDVWLVKCAAGTGDGILRAARQAGIAGVVVEGFGCGNVPLAVFEAASNLLAAGVPVVLTSRTASGRVCREYGYEGGAGSLEDRGAILGGSLSGQTARLLLMAGLGAGLSGDALRSLFWDE